jgi:hypothetical protein
MAPADRTSVRSWKLAKFTNSINDRKAQELQEYKAALSRERNSHFATLQVNSRRATASLMIVLTPNQSGRVGTCEKDRDAGKGAASSCLVPPPGVRHCCFGAQGA